MAMQESLQLLTFTIFPTYQQKLLNAIQQSTHCVISFDTAMMVLVPHYWYITIACTMDQSCIVFTGPSTRVHTCHQQDCANIMEFVSTLGQDACACPILESFSEEPVFTEAAIYLTMFRCYEGEYIAECARGHCCNGFTIL